MKINKKDLITQISNDTGLKKKDAELFLNAFTKAVICSTKHGVEVCIPHFGTFMQVSYPSKNIRNIATNEVQKNSSSYSIKFKASSAVKSCLKIEAETDTSNT